MSLGYDPPLKVGGIISLAILSGIAGINKGSVAELAYALDLGSSF